MNKGDKRILNEPLPVRTAWSIGTIPAGEVIEIQQSQDKWGNVLVHDVWMNASYIRRISSEVLEGGTGDE